MSKKLWQQADGAGGNGVCLPNGGVGAEKHKL